MKFSQKVWSHHRISVLLLENIRPLSPPILFQMMSISRKVANAFYLQGPIWVVSLLFFARLAFLRCWPIMAVPFLPKVCSSHLSIASSHDLDALTAFLPVWLQYYVASYSFLKASRPLWSKWPRQAQFWRAAPNDHFCCLMSSGEERPLTMAPLSLRLFWKLYPPETSEPSFQLTTTPSASTSLLAAFPNTWAVT